MANIPAVSVVVPLFNAERYVAACLESLLYQTLTDFEVIVVDDCSTDSSVAVVESYIPKFGGRLKLSRMKKNSGSGGLPRNKGLQHSRGEYIFFVDADDFVTPTALEELYTLAKNFDADVVYCEKIFDTDAAATNVWLTNMNGKFSVAAPTFVTENLAERVHEILQLRFCVETVLKFVRREFLIEQEIFFPQIRPSEDGIWTYGLILFAKKFLRVPNAVYVRRLSEGSVMRAERTPAQEINFWLGSVIAGIKIFNELLIRLEFFRCQPRYRYALLEHFVHLALGDLFQASLKLQPSEIFSSLEKNFAESLGEYGVLIPFLFADLIEQQKIFVANNTRQDGK